jgi:hypothetical protein
MTHPCCPDCGLRFGRRPSPELSICPHCDRPIAHLPAASTMGYRLAEVPSDLHELETAIAGALARPVPPADRS